MAALENGIKVTGSTGKPIQIIPQSEKTPEWFKKNANFHIARSNFAFGTRPNERKDLRLFYEVYNNEFPLSWFEHFTDPLSATKDAHKAFPAKVRPVTILRTNIDLLQGEYTRRPFIYNVENLGEDGYIKYTEGLVEEVSANLTQWFINSVLQQMQANGEQLTPEQEQQIQEDPPIPEKIKEQFEASYKDALAIKGQKWLRRMIREKNMRQVFQKMFKDWLIAGQAYSYKGVANDEFIYERISPLMLDYDLDKDNDYIEDGEWIVCRRLMNMSAIVDRYYHSLSEKENKDIERNAYYQTPTAFYSHLRGLFTDGAESNKIPVFHVQWKGKRKVGFLTRFDPETFAFVESQVDEDYPVDHAAGEQVEWVWVNVVYETTRIMNDIFPEKEMGELAVQRNEMNNVSSCKLSYNGRKYSDLHADNVSVLEIGLPFQIMYIITNYTIEKTIAKSKGKILLIDQNAIPNEGDWDEEKFFYYSEAMGYGLLNRNQIGVDKSWNQYQVLDMGLFDQIKQLIELKNSFKQEWDDIIGITRQRKGQTYTSDGQGVNERSVFQSTVITDMIFVGFEQLIERELQGTMDYCKYLTAKGVRAIYNDDDYNTQLLEIEPEDFTNSSMGVFLENSVEIMRKKEKMEEYALAMIQNNAKPSTVLEVIDSVNIAELRTKLKRIEAIEQQIAQQNAQSEQEAQQAAIELQEQYAAYNTMLETRRMHEEYDRKEDLLELEKALENSNPEIPESTENEGVSQLDMMKLSNDRDKVAQDMADKRANRKLKEEELNLRIKEFEHTRNIDAKEISIKEKKLVIDRKKAVQRPKTNK